MRFKEILPYSSLILLASISLGEGLWKSISLFLVFTLVYGIVLEVYSFPKESIPVEEDLKNLDKEGRLRKKAR